MTNCTPAQARQLADKSWDMDRQCVAALRSLADQLEQALSHPKSVEADSDVIAAPAAMPQYWSVAVSVDGEDIVSIGHDWLSGSRPLEEGDEQTILGAAQHLLSFIGYGLPASSFDPEEAAAAPVVPAPGAYPERIQVTEAMHRAAVKVLHRAHGLDGLPQRMMDAMLAATPPQAAPVAQLSEPPKLAFDEAHIDYIDRYGGFCRDCADEDGVCPSSGLPCGGSKKAIRHVLTALAYGVNHGYIPVVLAAAPTTPKELT